MFPDFNFLKISCATVGGLFTTQFPYNPTSDAWDGPIGLGRVTANSMNIYEQPDFNDNRITNLESKKLVWLFDEFASQFGPKHNPIWYKVKHVYAHNAYGQRIEQKVINRPLLQMPTETMNYLVSPGQCCFTKQV